LNRVTETVTIASPDRLSIIHELPGIRDYIQRTTLFLPDISKGESSVTKLKGKPFDLEM
jgi:hypothetical protein